MAEKLFSFKSTAETVNGIISALKHNSDFLDDMSEEEQKEYVKDAMAEGSLEADGKNITVWML